MNIVVWVVLMLAAYRLWRLLALDDLTRDVRERFGARLHPRLEAAIYCPWCLGFWCCVAVFGLASIWVSLPLVVAQVAAASTVVGFLGAHDEA